MNLIIGPTARQLVEPPGRWLAVVEVTVGVSGNKRDARHVARVVQRKVLRHLRKRSEGGLNQA